MSSRVYHTKKAVIDDAKKMMGKCLRDIMSPSDIRKVESKIRDVYKNRKGFLGNLVEEFVFDQEINSRHEPDFKLAGLELKTTPLKKMRSMGYAAKERLVFSMIDFMKIVDEDWIHSTFMKKNNLILLMFYLYEHNLGLLDYDFKFIFLLDLLGGLSRQDALQIRKDWEHIVGRIRKGEAHLLSEGETFYLGACTKASDSSKTRQQPYSRIPAKPRAFSLKQKYLNYIIQNKILRKSADETESIFHRVKKTIAIDDIVAKKLKPFMGMTDLRILRRLHKRINQESKQYKRLLATSMLGVSSSNIEEFEKANVTLKVVALEHSGVLKESISFPYFDYKEMADQRWEESDFYKVLEESRFLFMIFRKAGSGGFITFEGFKFWNFPASDMPEAEKVWRKAKRRIKSGDYSNMPKISESSIAHVRPHGKDSRDTIDTPQGFQVSKKSFWLNAKYIQHALGI